MNNFLVWPPSTVGIEECSGWVSYWGLAPGVNMGEEEVFFYQNEVQ